MDCRLVRSPGATAVERPTRKMIMSRIGASVCVRSGVVRAISDAWANAVGRRCLARERVRAASPAPERGT